MDINAFLKEACVRFGPSGHEYLMANWLKEVFTPYCDNVQIDPLFNVLAHIKPKVPSKGKPPKIIMCAHMDEIALMVTEILKDGSVRIGNVGGVDPRILPCAIVDVHCSGSDKIEKLAGVIGAKPPHLLEKHEMNCNYKREDLYIDLGMSYEKVKSLVNVGDLVTLRGEATELLNNRIAAKTMDDRACIGVMLEAAKRLKNINNVADITFACTTQEEVGCRGAKVAATNVDPDLAIVMDVTHATLPSSKPDSTLPLDAPAATYGPFIQHKLLEQLQKTAKDNNVKLNIEHAENHTGTDTDNVQIAREGIPCVLIDLPLKYMHTTVELIDINALAECGRLVALFATQITEGWDNELWI